MDGWLPIALKNASLLSGFILCRLISDKNSGRKRFPDYAGAPFIPFCMAGAHHFAIFLKFWTLAAIKIASLAPFMLL